MHSASVTFESRYVEWKNVKKQEPVANQRTKDVHRRFGTHECVPCEHIPAFFFQTFFTTTPPVFQMLLAGTTPRTQLVG